MQSIAPVKQIGKKTQISIVRDALIGLLLSLSVGLMASLVLGLITMLLGAPVYASGQAVFGNQGSVTATVKNPYDISRGSLIFKTGEEGVYQQAPNLATNVVIDVSGIVVRATVEQMFQNTSDSWVEGIYVFPLPDDAAVDHMHIQIGTRIIEGQIHERRQAKKLYEAAKRAGHRASLVEQQRPNIFSNSVANIGPGERITVTIEYQHTLKYQRREGVGQFQIRFPMAITPRFTPATLLSGQQQIVEGLAGSFPASDISQINPPIHIDIGANKINPISLTIELDTGFPIREIKSPYHEIFVSHHAEGRVTITLQQAAIPMDRDFNLIWSVDAGAQPMAALFHESIENQQYHLVMITPPTEGIYGSQPLAREVIYIIDTSGSMAGDSIVQAKKALQMGLERLRPRDQFNIIQFNSSTDLLFGTAQPASGGNLLKASRYIDSLDADGGTEMQAALEAALLNQPGSEYVRQIIFLTDGAVGNESHLFGLIRKQLSNSRLFMIGIGSAPNSYFMSKAAKFGRGTFTFIGNVKEVQEKMEALFLKLESPVLTDLEITWPDGQAVEMWPKKLPDLYFGEPVVVIAKTERNIGMVKISGIRSNDRWAVELPLTASKSAAGVGVLWARSKISSLMDSIHEGVKKEDVRKQVIDVALRHHLVSKYTSLVAVDITPARAEGELLQSRTVKQNLPNGMQQDKVFGQLSQTATLAQVNILLGSLLLGIALLAIIQLRITRSKKRVLA